LKIAADGKSIKFVNLHLSLFLRIARPECYHGTRTFIIVMICEFTNGNADAQLAQLYERRGALVALRATGVSWP
jgi:hypothetical protein